MQKPVFFLLVFIAALGCKDPQRSPLSEASSEILNIEYAKGFSIEQFDNYKVLTLSNPWPDAEQEFKYALVNEGFEAPSGEFDAVVELPLKNIVVTSTTHIPSLEMLEVSEKLVGFPNLDYISSEATRRMIADGKIMELGKNEDINTEVLIDLSPDVVVTFAVEGNNSTVNTIQKTGIPVIYNADWTETTPLGKAEWIKFFGVLFGKEKEADSIFKTIETGYNAARETAAKATETPKVLSGAMYKDVWYLPQGNSWAAQFIKDANGDYLWNDTEGTGSLSLNLEAVLEKGKNAEYWIGPGQFVSKQQMEDAHSVYAQFDPFQNNHIYSFTTRKGETGGVLYYELAPNRPDLVLKDIIKILHPELLPEHQLYFFSRIE
ncbi:ABC transporter substrate-binding protein [Constantimarinum furrinae]|uniref:Iron complex transport system substrate-binding protein n=1 Tax=Constantimarinum furrinae TaxID=2562285 RepID=A0A7G8PW09_9FLAO|nr:ABC transporter substrate-binding protein [Constantimarinum furrinae]QNJ98525.1 iron complex transport system substrate-binding protein [Constantimarinum furrinae]